MSKFEEIRFFHDSEVQPALQKYMAHPMVKALLHFTFPNKDFEEIQKILEDCNSIRDFQTRVIYHSVRKVLERSSEGLSYSGFETLKKFGALSLYLQPQGYYFGHQLIELRFV